MNEDRVVEMGRRMNDVLNRLDQQSLVHAPSGADNGGNGPSTGRLGQDDSTQWRQPPSGLLHSQQKDKQQQDAAALPTRTAWQDFDRSVNSGIAPSAPPLSEERKQGVGAGVGGEGGVAVESGVSNG